MDSPLSTLGFVIFGITFSIYSGIAKSQPPPLVFRPSIRPPPSLPPPYRVPPHPPYTPPPSPPLRPPHSLSQPPPSSSLPNLPQADSGPKSKTSPANSKHRRHHRSPPPPPSHRMNVGKKIGLLFAGIAGIMQIGVVGFLVFKRSQLLRTKNAFEASA